MAGEPDTTTTVVGVILAGGAFVISVLSLYLSNLRRANIVIRPLDRPIRTGGGTRRGNDGELPHEAPVWLQLGAVNLGARAGVLTDIGATRTQTEHVVIQSSEPRPNFRDGELGSLPLAAGDSKAILLIVSTAFPLAEIPSGSQTFPVEIRYSFMKGGRFLNTAHREFTIHVPFAEIVT